MRVGVLHNRMAENDSLGRQTLDEADHVLGDVTLLQCEHTLELFVPLPKDDEGEFGA